MLTHEQAQLPKPIIQSIVDRNIKRLHNNKIQYNLHLIDIENGQQGSPVSYNELYDLYIDTDKQLNNWIELKESL